MAVYGLNLALHGPRRHPFRVVEQGHYHGKFHDKDTLIFSTE